MTPEIAEFIGILIGDGHIGDGGFSIAGHSINDKEYLLGHVTDLIEKLFGIAPKIIFKKDQQTMYLRLRSVMILDYLEKIGLKKGPKNDIKIPSWIYDNEVYMKQFLRGMVDTDGSLAIKKRYKKVPYYPVISIVSKNKDFIFIIADWLKKRDFYLWVGMEKKKEHRIGYNDTIISRVQLSGYSNFNRWQEMRGFSNPRHIAKFNLVGRVGVSPTIKRP